MYCFLIEVILGRGEAVWDRSLLGLGQYDQNP